MTKTQGDHVPDATLLQLGADGPETVDLASLTKGKAAIFALPGAYTGTCSEQHVPSFVRNADALRAKGVDEIICISVNDPFVLAAWSKDTGAGDAGIKMLGDADGSFTKAMGMDFDAPPAGLHGRSKRYAMVVENGVIKVMKVEESPGVCDISGGESILKEL